MLSAVLFPVNAAIEHALAWFSPHALLLFASVTYLNYDALIYD